MNIGDGLTLQSRTVGGKVTSGIYFAPSHDDKISKQQTKSKYKSSKSVTRNNKDLSNNNSSNPNRGAEHKVSNSKFSSRNNDVRTKQRTNNKGAALSDLKDNDVLFIDNNTKVDVEPSDKAKSPLGSRETSEQKVRSKPAKTVVNSNRNNHNNSNNKGKRLSGKDAKPDANQIKVDTKFVTLTQDQLNTILSLVKTKQDIDVADALRNGNTADDKNEKSSDEKNVEPTSVPGLDLSDSESRSGSRPTSNKENIANLLEATGENIKNRTDKETKRRTLSATKKSENNDETASDSHKEDRKKAEPKIPSISQMSGTLGGYGSRDREKSRLEARRKQWVADLNEQVERKKQLHSKKDSIRGDLTMKSSSVANVEKLSQENKRSVTTSTTHRSAPTSATHHKSTTNNESRSTSSINVEKIHEKLPSAIRSSFFLGEAAPRDHAFSAKKKQEQQEWREELEKQIKEKAGNRVRKNANEDYTDDDLWTRHFETMNQVAKAQPLDHRSSSSNLLVDKNDHETEIDSVIDHNHPAVQPHASLNPIVGQSSNDAFPGDQSTLGRNNHLRTMTALLDPSQIDAIELKRQKQQEHRRAIAEQMEERRRLKEEADRAIRMEEELEEKRLEDERRKMKNQFEREKNKQHAMEEQRDKQTQELYQQMQEAQASALREKFEKRQQNLRNHGHDTSRLERTHKNTLENNIKHLRPLHSPVHYNNPVPPLNVNALQSASEHSLIYDNAPSQQVTSRSPVSVVANTNQGAIKLEISLNQSQPRNELVATAVQTDQPNVATRRQNNSFLGILSDSDDTEYIPLPHPSARNAPAKKKKSKKNMNQENRERNSQYDRYSRTSRHDDDADFDHRNQATEKPKWGVGQQKKHYVPASQRYPKQWKDRKEDRVRRREEQLLAQQAMNDPGRLFATRKAKSDAELSDWSPTHNAPAPQDRNQRKERSRSPAKQAVASTSSHKMNKQGRSTSPPVPAVMNRLRGQESPDRSRKHRNMQLQDRPETAMSVTTDQAKYKSSKHSANSPVPDTVEYVEYRRSDVILDPNNVSSRPESMQRDRGLQAAHVTSEAAQPVTSTSDANKDPLLNADIVKQRDRQDKILREISILRQGLLLKQREVASYPVAMTMSGSSSLNRNLPERTNEVALK